MGNVPNIYKLFGSQGESILISKAIIDKIVSQHDISVKELKLIPKRINDPIFIFKGNSSNYNSIVSVIDMVDNNGRQIIIPIYMNEVRGKKLVNRIASIYGRNNFQNYVQEQGLKGNLLYKKQ